MQRWNQYENTLNVNNVAQLQLKWSSSVNTSTDSPAVAGGIVYVGTGGREIGYVYALDAASGIEKWTYGNANGFPSPPAVANGIVYIGNNPQGGPADGLYAMNASTGKFDWACCGAGAPVYSAPTIVSKIIYFIDGNGHIYALDSDTGATLWTYTAGNGSSSSPAVANGVVYVGSDDQNFYALNATTGEQIWIYTTGQQIDSSQAVANGMVYFASDNVYALDATTRALKWLFPVASGGSPAVANSTLYIGSYDGNVYALNAVTGAKLWSFTTGGQCSHHLLWPMAWFTSHRTSCTLSTLRPEVSCGVTPSIAQPPHLSPTASFTSPRGEMGTCTPSA